MNSPLQKVHLTAMPEQAIAPTEDQGIFDLAAEEEGHIHLPNPSFWPIILSAALLLCMVGFLFIDSSPWILVIAIPIVLIAILGLGVEDPMAPQEHAGRAYQATSYGGVAGGPTTLAQAVLQRAEAVAEGIVTLSSTEWSAHPVHIEIEEDLGTGVVLALYGKVELEAQREELEKALRQLPGVVDVKNFLVAEDALLNAVNARIEKLKAEGKLEGAKNIYALVENYIINLYGEAPTNEMKYRLERELITIPGVRVIVNRINLRDIPGELGKTRHRVGGD
jgi:hypothetical protein